jgi:hypothetical protein
MQRIPQAESELRRLLAVAGSRSTFIFSIYQHWLTPASNHDVVVFAESYVPEIDTLENDQPASGALDSGCALRLIVTDQLTQAATCNTTWTLQQIADHLDAAIVDLAMPLGLEPVHIPKPWGQEIWFTGVEARGVCQFSQRGRAVPIPWIVQICGSLLRGAAGDQLVLLKILDPLPEAVFGDLYVELHEKKQEVYVVTNIDNVAWPSGIGGIRFGFDQQKRQQYDNDEAFRAAYLAAVRRYRDVRVAIDKALDDMRVLSGVALDAPVTAGQQKVWLAAVQPGLVLAEQSLRLDMDSFYGQLPLKLGDVVKVPCFVPHSLQHGVRTIEFQTPVYERKILSFAQKVLTQSSWDTEQAMTLCGVGPVQAGQLQLLDAQAGTVVERIVDFDAFEVFRITLTDGASLVLETLCPHRDYAVVMTVSGVAQVAARELPPSAALLLPPGCPDWTLRAVGGEIVAVVAMPKTVATPKTPPLC